MAIHAKKSGLLIGGKVVMENDDFWLFQSLHNKRPKLISKESTKESVFFGTNAIEDAMNWQVEARKKK